MKFRKFSSALVLIAAAFSLQVMAGDVVVIVHKDNANAVDKAMVTKIYTGDAKSWPDGSAVAAFDQSDDAVRGDFAAIIGKTAGNLKSLWAQLMFSGKAMPPKVVGSDADVKSAVSGNKNAIGYIKAASVDASVKVVVK